MLQSSFSGLLWYYLDKLSSFIFILKQGSNWCHLCSLIIEGNVSSVQKVTYWTARGSILGPLIFIIHFNDLFKEINIQNNIIMYADETLLISSAESSLESVLSCQLMLDKIMAWCNKNKLTVDIKKKMYAYQFA